MQIVKLENMTLLCDMQVEEIYKLWDDDNVGETLRSKLYNIYLDDAIRYSEDVIDGCMTYSDELMKCFKILFDGVKYYVDINPIKKEKLIYLYENEYRLFEDTFDKTQLQQIKEEYEKCKDRMYILIEGFIEELLNNIVYDFTEDDLLDFLINNLEIINSLAYDKKLERLVSIKYLY